MTAKTAKTAKTASTPTNPSHEPCLAEIEGWAHELDALHARIAPRFERAEPRRRSLAYLKGLLSHTERKNGWQLAEEAGEGTPGGMQRLLNASRWDVDAVRDDLVAYVREHLANPAAILVIDETGFLKKGTKSAGVQRQYCGTAGKLDNCQVGVFLTSSSLVPAQTQVLVDRELYLPEDWIADLVRRREAGVPDDVTFATKPELARRMLERARAAELAAAWVTGDMVYGGSGPLRAWLEAQRQPYVLAIAANDGVDLPAGEQTSMHVLPKEIATYALDPHEWRRLSAGDGSKGARLYDCLHSPLPAADCRRIRAGAADPSPPRRAQFPGRPQEAGLLSDLCADRHPPGDTGHGGGATLDD